MYKEAGGSRNRGHMRGQADTRLKNTTVGMLRKSCCCEMGWWGHAKRKEFKLIILVARNYQGQEHVISGRCVARPT
eukprot:6281998-Pyramimonas_sp.AAC.1